MDRIICVTENFPTSLFTLPDVIVGRICNSFEKNRAIYDKSMKLGTWLVDNNTKKLRVSATLKMSSNGRHLVFPKWPPFSTYALLSHYLFANIMFSSVNFT